MDNAVTGQGTTKQKRQAGRRVVSNVLTSCGLLCHHPPARLLSGEGAREFFIF